MLQSFDLTAHTSPSEPHRLLPALGFVFAHDGFNLKSLVMNDQLKARMNDDRNDFHPDANFSKTFDKMPYGSPEGTDLEAMCYSSNVRIHAPNDFEYGSKSGIQKLNNAKGLYNLYWKVKMDSVFNYADVLKHLTELFADNGLKAPRPPYVFIGEKPKGDHRPDVWVRPQGHGSSRQGSSSQGPAKAVPEPAAVPEEVPEPVYQSIPPLLLSTVAKEYGVQLDSTFLFNYPTLHDIAGHIVTLGEASGTGELVLAKELGPYFLRTGGKHMFKPVHAPFPEDVDAATRDPDAPKCDPVKREENAPLNWYLPVCVNGPYKCETCDLGHLEAADLEKHGSEECEKYQKLKNGAKFSIPLHSQYPCINSRTALQLFLHKMNSAYTAEPSANPLPVIGTRLSVEEESVTRRVNSVINSVSNLSLDPAPAATVHMCDECGAKFTSKNKLKTHFKKHGKKTIDFSK